MLAPEFFYIRESAASNIYIVSALVTTFSVIAISEVSQITRLLNIPLALWLMASSFFLGEMNEIAIWHSVLVGLILIILSLPFGRRSHSFGSSDKWIHYHVLEK